MRIRPFDLGDLDAVCAIAVEGGSPDGDHRYFRFVSTVGRLRVAIDGDGAVAGFAGSIAVGDTTMVTDMFVAQSQRGGGVGAALLAAVTEGSDGVVTFSSTHPAALALYRRAGLTPQWDLVTMRGAATGGGAPLAPGPWQHDRADVVAHFRDAGALVGAHHVVLPAHRDRPTMVWRLMSDRPSHDAARLMASLPAGAPVEWSLPEPHPLAAWLLEHDFQVVDRDVCCSTRPWNVPAHMCSVHRGLL